MGNLILHVLQEQGILVVLGLLVVGGIVGQILAVRRYRRLRAEIQSLAGYRTTPDRGTSMQGTSEGGISPMGSEAVKNRRTRRRQEVDRSDQDMGGKVGRRASHLRQIPQELVEVPETAVHTPPEETRQDLDSQLTYLKQSLDRIAAGRDQTMEEEVRERRKLTPEQEAVIVDILREYLS